MSSIYQKESGIYYCGVMVDTKVGRKQKSVSLGTKDYKKAVKLARKVEDELSSINLSKLLFYWKIRKLENFNSQRYIREVERYFDELIDHFGNIPVNSITKQKLRGYKFWLLNIKKNNKTTVGIKLRSIKAVFNFGYSEDFVSSQVFKGLKIPKGEERVNFLSVPEIKKLLKVAREANPLQSYFIELMLMTGCRIGELKNLKWTDIKHDFIEFNGKTGYKPFKINGDINRVLNKIKKIQEPCEFVLSNEDGIWLGKYNWFSRLVKRYMLEAGLDPKYVTHSLRHTFCSHQVINGKSIYLVKEWAGHSSVKVTEKYAHLRPELTPGKYY